MEEETSSTAYAPSIEPFQRRKDGRGFWNAIISQYVGEDNWRAELKIQDDLLRSLKWKGHIKDDVFPAISRPLAAIIGWGLYPYSTEYGSVEGELVDQASHSHALFCNDNAQLYH